MAFIDTNKDDEELANGQPAQTGPAAGSATLEGGGGAPGGGAGASVPVDPSAPSAGAGTGNFVGLKQYLDANKQQSQKLAGNIGGYVEGASDNAKTTLKDQSGLYNQEVDNNTVNLDQNLFDEAKSNTVGVAADQNKKTQFQKMRDAEYKGPQNLETSSYFNPINDALQKAASVNENSKTEQGQKSLINQYQKDTSGKQGSIGATNFDQLLLQDAGGKERLAKARESYTDVNPQFEAAKQAAAAKAAQASQATAATKAAIQGEFSGGGGSSQQTLENQLKNRAVEQIGISKNQQNSIKKQLSLGQPMTPSTLKALGVSPEQYSHLQDLMEESGSREVNKSSSFYSLDGVRDVASNYYNQNLLANHLDIGTPESQINAQNVANADEYARYGALNQLMGTQNSFLNDPSQAGKANTDAINLNYKGVEDFLNNLVGADMKGGTKSRFNDAPAAMASRVADKYQTGGILSNNGKSLNTTGQGIGLGIAGDPNAEPIQQQNTATTNPWYSQIFGPR